MRSFLFGIFLVLLACNAFSVTKKVILLKHGPESFVENIVKNIKFLETLPFDGIEVEAYPECCFAFAANKPITYEQLYNKLKPMQGISNKLNRNSALIYGWEGYAGGEHPRDWYNEAAWNGYIDKWRMFARACKETGLKGITFDNEAYDDIAMHYIYGGMFANVDSSSKYTMDQYIAQCRKRGRQLMQACIEEYPTIDVWFAHGPEESEMNTSGWHAYDLAPAFFTGFVEATVGTQATVTDGAECAYGFSELEQYQNIYKSVKDILPSASHNSRYIPVSLRPYWSL